MKYLLLLLLLIGCTSEKLPPLYGNNGGQLPFVLKESVKEFHLTASPIRWAYAKDKWVHAWAYNDQIPGPEIRVTEGDKIRVVVTNNLPVPTTIHWHGLEVPFKQDGIPGITQDPIQSGETFTYEFTAKPAGTFFYHTHGSSHMDEAAQLDMGLSGAFIIESKEKEKYDREYVLLLDEWEVGEDGSNAALTEHHGSHIMNYNVFTINGKTFPDTTPLHSKEGERVLVRLINAGSSSIHPMHLHGHPFSVIAVDGRPMPAQLRDTLPMAPGERYDIIINATNPGAWLFHCHELHHADGGMIIPLLYDGFALSSSSHSH